MSFLDSKPINIRKYIYRQMADDDFEFLHTTLCIEGAREYAKKHYRLFSHESNHYQIREVEKVIEDIIF